MLISKPVSYIAHEHEVERRNQDFNRIMNEIRFKRSGSAVRKTEYGDFVFAIFGVYLSIYLIWILFVYDSFCSQVIFFGDFNYRLMGSRHNVVHLLKENNLEKLYTMDQLVREKAAGRTFKGFTEFPLTFMPTYKLDTGTLRYDTR